MAGAQQKLAAAVPHRSCVCIRLHEPPKCMVACTWRNGFVDRHQACCDLLLRACLLSCRSNAVLQDLHSQLNQKKHSLHEQQTQQQHKEEQQRAQQQRQQHRQQQQAGRSSGERVVVYKGTVRDATEQAHTFCFEHAVSSERLQRALTDPMETQAIIRDVTTPHYNVLLQVW